MAEVNSRDNGSATEEAQKLQDVFMDGWKLYEQLENTNLASNSTEFQGLVKTAMEHLENATRMVSLLDLFSDNELIDEVSTESLQYLQLPFFLGKLALKLQRPDRGEVLDVAEIYFNDYLKRCEEYELCEQSKKIEQVAKTGGNVAPTNELAELMSAAHSRNAKIEQFARKKQLEEFIGKLKQTVLNGDASEEVKREFLLKFFKLAIIDAQDELKSLQLEKQMVLMRKVHMSDRQEAGNDGNDVPMYSRAATRPPSDGHGHGHGHCHHHSTMASAPKPLQPFIITRNATQKAVFGAGYPSLPVMTVDEFYTQRVLDGVFPDEEKVAKMNAAQAVAAAQDPNEKEDAERAVEELQIENDDPEYLARMRRMDEYKDVVRRGDGNRHNRS